jgi:hypothetical protein
MANLIDAGGRGGIYARSVVAQAEAAILPEVRRLIDESIGRIAVRAGGNLTAIGIRSALMFDPAATAVVDDPDHEQVIVPLGGGAGGLDRCTAKLFGSALTIPTGALTDVPMDEDEFDPDGWHNEGTSSPTIVVPTGGDYLISYRFFFVTVGLGTYDTGTYRRVHIAVSGGGGGWSHDHYAPPSPTGFLRGFSIIGSYPLTIGAGGANVKMQVQQDSGVDMSYDAGGFVCPLLSVTKIG